MAYLMKQSSTFGSLSAPGSQQAVRIPLSSPNSHTSVRAAQTHPLLDHRAFHNQPWSRSRLSALPSLASAGDAAAPGQSAAALGHRLVHRLRTLQQQPQRSWNEGHGRDWTAEVQGLLQQYLTQAPSGSTQSALSGLVQELKGAGLLSGTHQAALINRVTSALQGMGLGGRSSGLAAPAPARAPGSAAFPPPFPRSAQRSAIHGQQLPGPGQLAQRTTSAQPPSPPHQQAAAAPRAQTTLGAGPTPPNSPRGSLREKYRSDWQQRHAASAGEPPLGESQQPTAAAPGPSPPEQPKERSSAWQQYIKWSMPGSAASPSPVSIQPYPAPSRPPSPGVPPQAAQPSPSPTHTPAAPAGPSAQPRPPAVASVPPTPPQHAPGGPYRSQQAALYAAAQGSLLQQPPPRSPSVPAPIPPAPQGLPGSSFPRAGRAPFRVNLPQGGLLQGQTQQPGTQQSPLQHQGAASTSPDVSAVPGQTTAGLETSTRAPLPQPLSMAPVVQQLSIPGVPQLGDCAQAGTSGSVAEPCTVPERAQPGRGVERAVCSAVFDRYASAYASVQSETEVADPLELKQGSAEWHKFRSRKITASSFGTALGFHTDRDEHRNQRQTLFLEKLGYRPPFKGNRFTVHGTKSEPIALEAYRGLSAHIVQGGIGADTLGKGPTENWLAASPDGLIDAVLPGAGAVHLAGLGPGMLEIKCPSKPQPWDSPPAYYMPQVQGQMEVFKREWANLYCWTASGSRVFHIKRDPEYWGLCLAALQRYWWDHLLPAMQAKDTWGWPEADIRRLYMPPELDQDTQLIKDYSQAMVQGATRWSFNGAGQPM